MHASNTLRVIVLVVGTLMIALSGCAKYNYPYGRPPGTTEARQFEAYAQDSTFGLHNPPSTFLSQMIAWARKYPEDRELCFAAARKLVELWETGTLKVETGFDARTDIYWSIKSYRHHALRRDRFLPHFLELMQSLRFSDPEHEASRIELVKLIVSRMT